MVAVRRLSGHHPSTGDLLLAYCGLSVGGEGLVPWACMLSHAQLFRDLTDCSLPCSSVHGISQARILEWVAISFCRGSS